MNTTTAELKANASARESAAGALTMGAPAVSVIIPAYNVAPFIAGALQSVFAQTFTDYEVIVVNDGAPDTPEIEAAIAPWRERIVYLVQENRGLSGARNTGIRAARGEFVALLDGDDEWLPDYLAVQVEAMRNNPEYDVFYPDAIIFGDSVYTERTFMDLLPSSGEVTFERLITQECNVMICSMIRRATLLRVGLFDESLRSSEDFDLWLRILKSGGRIGYHKQPLARYRRHAASLSANVVSMRKYIFRVLDKAVEAYDLAATERSAIERRRMMIDAEVAIYEGKRAFLNGDVEGAVKHLTRANVVYNSRKISLVIRLLRIAPRILLGAYYIRDRYIFRMNTWA